ncbi:MAG: hypothetical protein UD936_09920 [Acutalibacteraceae bacterium]|nr:hypothetical protein [Acutalibacteraceae bacterium]
MIKCPNCGFENDDNCTFCAICGSSVVQDDFYVHNTTSNSFSVDELNEKLIAKENQKTKSFKKLDKATLAKEAAKIEIPDTRKEEAVKEYKSNSSKKPQQKNQEPAPKADKKADAKADNKADTKADLKADNKANNKADTKADSKTTAKSEIKADKTENKSDNKADNKTDKKASVKTDTKADSKTTAKSEIKAENKKPADNNKNTATQSSTNDSKLYTLLSKFLFDTKTTTKLFKQKDIDENCNLALIGYIPFLFFVPMIIKPCSGYVRFHGIQGLTLFLVSLVLELFDILLGVIFNCALNNMPAVILTIIFTVAINLAILLFISTGIANAVKGEARELPVIGKYKLLKQYIY